MFPYQPPFHPSSDDFSTKAVYGHEIHDDGDDNDELQDLMTGFDEEPSLLAHDYCCTNNQRLRPHDVVSSQEHSAKNKAVKKKKMMATSSIRGGRDTQSVATFLRRFDNFSFAQLQRMKRDEEEKAAKERKASVQKRLSHAQPGSFNHRFAIARQRSPSPHREDRERQQRSISPHQAALSLMANPLFRQHADQMHRLRHNAQTAAFVDDVAPAHDLQPATELLRVFLCHLRGQSALPFVTDIRYYRDHVTVSLDGHELLSSVCPHFTKILEKHEGKLHHANIGGFTPNSPERRVLDRSGRQQEEEQGSKHLHRRGDAVMDDGDDGNDDVVLPQMSIRIFPVILESRHVNDTGTPVMVHHMPCVPQECEERDVVAAFMLPADLERSATAPMTLSADFTHHHNMCANATCTMRDGTLCNPWEASFIERTRVAFFKGQDAAAKQKSAGSPAASPTAGGGGVGLGSIEKLLQEATLAAKTRSILKERRKHLAQPPRKRNNKNLTTASSSQNAEEEEDADLIAVPQYEECHFSVGNSTKSGKKTTGHVPHCSSSSSTSSTHVQPQAVKFQSTAQRKFSSQFDWGKCFLDFTDLLAIQTMTQWHMLTQMNK